MDRTTITGLVIEFLLSTSAPSSAKIDRMFRQYNSLDYERTSANLLFPESFLKSLFQGTKVLKF